MKPDLVHLWLPRGDEHELAASLGLCENDPALLREIVERAQQQIARDHLGCRVQVHRWHVWRVVRALATLKLTNTPQNRSIAYVLLAENRSTL